MKAQYKVKPDLIIEVEGESQKDIFKALASAQEVLGVKKCFLCGGDAFFFWRTATVVKGKKTETYEFPEFRCSKNRNHCLSIGTINDDTGTLFPIRKLKADGSRPLSKAEKEAGEEGKYINEGWYERRFEKDEPDDKPAE